jgi:hypothetical protein
VTYRRGAPTALVKRGNESLAALHVRKLLSVEFGRHFLFFWSCKIAGGERRLSIKMQRNTALRLRKTHQTADPMTKQPVTVGQGDDLF